MYNKRNVLVIFIVIVALVYIYGVCHSYYYDRLIKESPMIKLDKSTFIDLEMNGKTIENRRLTEEETKTKHYKYVLDRQAFSVFENVNVLDSSDYYLMLEKPDCQYIEVYFNGIIIGRLGDLDGRSNLWNSTLFFKLTDTKLNKLNVLELKMTSDSMTGVTGDIRLLRYDEYRKIRIMTNYSYGLIDGASVVTLFVSFLLLLVIIAWRRYLYNLKVYIYFLISIFFIGLSMMDYKELLFLFVDYYIFKSLILLSYHVSVTFAMLAVAYILNLKRKFNIGMIGIVAILIAIFTSENMIQFQRVYTWLNYVVVLTGVQLIYSIFRYRKRAPLISTVMLFGFGLCMISIIKMVIIAHTTVVGTTMIDMPLLVIVYVTIIMFVVFIELVQMVGDNHFTDDRNFSSESRIKQGHFVLDRQLKVMGVYSNSCDHIFNKRIIGNQVTQFMFLEKDESEKAFIEETMREIFNPDLTFKDGFLALLPETLEAIGRIYKVSYEVVEKNETFLRITMNDITRNIELEEELVEQEKFYDFIINALKSRQEINYFINKIKEFIGKLEQEGFTENNLLTLHTFKGNLGQLGFYQLEKDIHNIESIIESGDYVKGQLIRRFADSFDESLTILSEYIGEEFFNVSYNQVLVPLEELLALEKAYSSYTKKEHYSETFFSHLKAIKYVNFTYMLKRYEEYVERIAMENEKGLFPMEIVGPDIRVLGSKAEDLVRVMVALFRNSIVHGIETPEERINLEKDSFGKINCKTALVNGNIEIYLDDDGSGIDVDRILDRAIDNGIISANDAKYMSEKDKIHLIFKANMSQKEDIDLYAGRGIGLSAVYLTVTQLHGTIDVETKLGTGTAIKLSVPYESLID